LATDVTERGLERLIYTALAGHPRNSAPMASNGMLSDGDDAVPEVAES